MKQATKGFTLIEFVVIISIFAIMASIALFNFNGFRSNVSLNTLAHDIALTIRQAQVFGWSTTTAQLDQNGNPLRYADGIFFRYTNNAFERQFILYEKGDPTPGAEAYDDIPGTLDRTVDTIKIQGPNHISDIRTAIDKSDLLIDANHHITGIGGAAHQVTSSVSIAFSRPRPEAIFPATVAPTDVYLAIYISADTDTDPQQVDHVIVVSRFGEITVQ